ncbi:tetratricopeptide repeat protein [Fluviicola sp.]|jgi:tetratricopeptide (TPR) repeat protein|uniref:tetratricopeptide repeat protein n=1 Tax=Fluviicola sp. TaxID=1917219 RepID=UPI00281871E8|nr:tetratricopeptide repeat protein [Fluviicola sp.]MDR0802217.1 tetratricopeptide repeat protein [Fluviicola sp.]
MRFILFILLLVSSFLGWSQASEKYHSPLSGFYCAEDLFEKEQYSAARKEFRLFITDYKGSKNDSYYIKALYYEGLSALELFNNDAIDLLENFNREYPESIYRNNILFQIGRYYYQKKDYKRSIQFFKQLNRSTVDKENQEEYYFKLGYAYFDERNYPEAKLAFFEVKDSSSQYGTPGLYYYSHICYLDSSYQTALEGFEKLMIDSRFNRVVPYYITQIYYIQHKYQEVVDFAPGKVDSLKPAEQVEISHIIGDSYFHLEKYDEALPYLELYNSKSNTTRDDDYALALTYSRTSNCTKAVKYFDRVAHEKDVLAQIALYHAGECYTNMNELVYARTAFEAASELDMDKMIQEDALYNYALLSYKLDMNAYDEAVEAFKLYLEKYPDSKRKPVIYQYLVNVYTSTKNYQKALESLDQLTNKDIKSKSAYQLIAFNRGVELFQKSEYANAIRAFELVDKYPVSPEISAKAMYWSADAEFYLKNYSEAIKKYTQFMGMAGSQSSGLRNDALYNKGYAYLELKDYRNTQETFRDYLKQPDLTDLRKKADAYMRLADEYYRNALADYAINSQAIENYKAAYNLKQGYDDQALYYMSRTYGFMGKKDEKIQSLTDLINNYPKSRYVQRALEETARTYFEMENLDKSERYYKQIISDYPNSAFVKEAYHSLGDIAFKRSNFNQAESYYLKVLNEFNINDTICEREVSSLADVYRAQHLLSKIEALAGKYSCADSIATQVEDEYYRQGFDLYEKSEWNAAITEFDKYLNKYPKGKFYRDAMNQKADALYKLKKEEEAIAIYQITLTGPNDDYTELATVRTAKYLFNGNQKEAALPYYKRTEEVSSNPEYLNNARIGLMRCHFLLENYANAVEYAQKVLSIQQTTQLKLEAEYIEGISLSKEKRYAEAQLSLEYVVKNATTVWAAESKYMLAENAFAQSDYTQTETLVRELLKMKPGYDYWIAKALILQTKVLLQKKDLFQAENTIKSVVDHYPVKDDNILQEAGELYNEIMQLKTQPKTLTNPSDPTVIEVDEKTGK